MTDEDLREQLLAYIPEMNIRCGADPGPADAVEMLTTSTYQQGEALRYPNLKLVQKTGAGVESIMSDETLPESVMVARLRTDTSGQEMAEYALAYVLQEQRHLGAYRRNQANSVWQAYVPRRASDTTVAVLGLGRIGKLVADRFLQCDFKVAGWSRSHKEIPDVTCFSGMEQLPGVLGMADYVVCVLPSTAETTCLFNRDSFRWMKPGGYLINVGRGSLIDEDALIDALDSKLLAGAILDVMQTEPLPESSPLWQHEKVTLTPHVSGWHLGDAIKDIAENYRRLSSGEPLLNLVNRQLGY